MLLFEKLRAKQRETVLLPNEKTKKTAVVVEYGTTKVN